MFSYESALRIKAHLSEMKAKIAILRSKSVIDNAGWSDSECEQYFLLAMASLEEAQQFIVIAASKVPHGKDVRP